MVAYTERNISTEMFHGVCYIIVTCTIYMLQTIKHSHFHDVKNEGEIKDTVLSLCLRNTCIMLIDLRKREHATS